MDTLTDYVRWMGDFPIAMTGFRDVDALVLCALCYIDLSPVFSTGAERVRVSECAGMIADGRVRVMITGGDKGYPELLSAAASSKRFGELIMSDYCDIFRAEPPLQFSAVCFHDDADFSFLAYRGTDNSLAGWKEDFMISFMRTEAQELALQFAQEHIQTERRWRIGGQSKGSNLALYAASLLDEVRWSAIERVYLLDGPGFCPEVLDPGLIEHIDAKTTQIVPRFCIIGKLFAPTITNTKIVSSSAAGFMQHALITWGVDHGRLAESAEHDTESLIANEAIDEWITGISQADRKVFVDELFDTLSAGGAETLDEIRTGGREGLEAILKRLADASETTKRTLSDLPKYMMRVGMEKAKSKIASELEEVRKK